MKTTSITGVITGNAQNEADERRGWFVGNFITPAEDLRSTTAVEVKWGIHRAGDRRSQWADPSEVTTLSILIQGCFYVQFSDGDIILSAPGDYALWGPGIGHSWWTQADSVILTVRWPSQACNL